MPRRRCRLVRPSPDRAYHRHRSCTCAIATAAALSPPLPLSPLPLPLPRLLPSLPPPAPFLLLFLPSCCLCFRHRCLPPPLPLLAVDAIATVAAGYLKLLHWGWPSGGHGGRQILSPGERGVHIPSGDTNPAVFWHLTHLACSSSCSAGPAGLVSDS